MRLPIKLDIQKSKQLARRRSPTPASPVAHDLAAKLAKLHREYAGIGPLLFGIMYHQEIKECPDTPAKLAELAQVGDYDTDIRKGTRLAAHVLVRGDRN